MDFKEWLKLQELGTGTSCVAVFARPLLSSPVERMFPPILDPFADDDKPKEKPKKKKKH